MSTLISWSDILAVISNFSFFKMEQKLYRHLWNNMNADI